MDEKIDIKEEDPLANDIASLNERELLHEVVSVKTSIDAVLVTDCNMTAKTEVKSETPSIKHPVKQIKTERATCSDNMEMHRETEIEHHTLLSDLGSENEGEFLPEDPLMLDKEYNNDHEIHNKIEIKEEPWSLETETSSVCNNIKIVDLPPLSSSRSNTETFAAATNAKSPLPSSKVPPRDKGSCIGISCLEYEHQQCDALTAKEYARSDQYGKFSDKTDRYIEPLHLKQRNLSDMNKTQQCSICHKHFRSLSHLKAHILVHEGRKPHQCKVCYRSFTQLSNLKRHNLVHEPKKAYHCKVCDKSFTHSTNLKRHNLVHEGKQPYQCKVCDRSFTQLSTLKSHNLVHEGKKPYQCKVCDRSFTQLSNLKIHNLVHQGKKPHQCKVCGRSFTHSSTLKTHNLAHEGKKPHQCKDCDKSFTQLSTLKTHHLVHEGKRPHQCKVCGRSFNRLDVLKTHTLIHEGKKPYKCKICDKSFTQLSNFKRHNLVHESKKQH